MEKKERFIYLLTQYAEGKINAAEHDEFFELAATPQFNDLLLQRLQTDLDNGFDAAGAGLPPHIAQEIVRNIFKAEQSTAQILPLKPKRMWRWAAAASIIVVAVASYFIFTATDHTANNSFASFVPDNIAAEKNTTAYAKTVALPDGSKVTLQPNSTIHYPLVFEATQREVYLEGEGFFEVAKNPHQPFLVYYNNIITKVLGTSFIINTNKTNGHVEVLVKTGRVQVYENEKLIHGNEPPAAVILTPNQKAVYAADKRLLQTSIAENPAIILADEKEAAPAMEHFVYEKEKLVALFSQFEKAYGIQIIMENTNLGNCLFTGDLSGQGLFTKLKTVCLATNSSYEINGATILIKGPGCD